MTPDCGAVVRVRRGGRRANSFTTGESLGSSGDQCSSREPPDPRRRPTQELGPQRCRGRSVSRLGRRRVLPGRRDQRQARLLHRAAAPERHGQLAHGPCPGSHPHGRAQPSQADAGLRGAVATWHGSRRYRHAVRRREAARCRRQDKGRFRPRALHRQSLGLEARIGWNHRGPDAAHR